MKCYKITDKNSISGKYFGKPTKWGAGVSFSTMHEPRTDAPGNGWLHAYASPEIAVLMNPVCADYHDDDMNLWLSDGGGEGLRYITELMFTDLTTKNKVAIPQIGPVHRIVITVLYDGIVNESMRSWSIRYATGEDRFLRYTGRDSDYWDEDIIALNGLAGPLGEHKWKEYIRLRTAFRLNHLLTEQFLEGTYSTRKLQEVIEAVLKYPDPPDTYSVCMQEEEVLRLLAL